MILSIFVKAQHAFVFVFFLYQNECKCRLHNSYCNKHTWGQGTLCSLHLHIPNIYQIKYGRYVVWYTRINQKINYVYNHNNFKTRRCIVCTIANDKPIDRFPWIQMDIGRVSVSYLEFKSWSAFISSLQLYFRIVDVVCLSDICKSFQQFWSLVSLVL